MILAIIILLIAVLVLAVVSMIWDMKTVKKLESGMRTLNKRIKSLEKGTTWTINTSELEKNAIDKLSKMDTEDITYEAVDPELEEENDSTPTDKDNG